MKEHPLHAIKVVVARTAACSSASLLGLTNYVKTYYLLHKHLEYKYILCKCL